MNIPVTKTQTNKIDKDIEKSKQSMGSDFAKRLI